MRAAHRLSALRKSSPLKATWLPLLRGLAAGAVTVTVRALIFSLGQTGYCSNAFALIELDQAHALRIASDYTHVFDPQADDLAAVGNQHHVVVDSDLAHAHHVAGLVRHLHRDYAFAAAMGQAVLGSGRALAEAQFGNRKQGLALAHDRHRNHFVAALRVEVHSVDAVGRASHRADLVLLETDRLAHAGGEHHLLVAVGDTHPNERVFVFQQNRDDAVGANVFVLVEFGLLDHSAAGGEEQVFALQVLRQRQESRQRLALLQAQQIGDGTALGRASAFGQLIGLERVHLSGGGEEKQPVMRGNRHQVLDEVLFDSGGADLAPPAAPLGAIERQRSTLDIAAVGDGDQHILFNDQVLDREIAFALDNLGAARVGEFFLDVLQLIGDKLHQLALVGQDLAEADDVGGDFLVLVFDLAALQRGQTAQRQVEDRLGLDLGQLEAVHQLVARGFGVLGGANQLDNRVEILQRDPQSFQNVQARFSLAQLELRAACHHTPAMVQKRDHHLAQVHLARPPLEDTQHDEPVALLHLGQLEELVEHNLGLCVALEFDHNPHAVPVGLVAQVADSFDPPFVDQLANTLQQPGLVDLVGNLANDDRRAPAALVGFHRCQRAHGQAAALVEIGLAHCLGPQQLAAGGKIGTGNDVEDLLQAEVRIVDQGQQRVADLAQVMGRNIGGHPDRDSVRAVDQQVGDLRGQHRRLVLRAVEVGNEIDGVLVDIGQQPFRQSRQAAFGIAIMGGRVAVDRTEVA